MQSSTPPEAGSDAASSHACGNQHPPAPTRILLADDDALSRELLLQTLQQDGFDVLCAGNGDAAANLLLAPGGPRIAILDGAMPGEDGLDVCRRIRASESNPYVYLILLNARAGNGDVVAGLEAGADDCLTRPWDPAELKARVRAGLRILQVQDRLIHDARHDALTGLPNRIFFLDRLSESARRAREKPDRRFAVLFVDIDRFKVINDSLGHISGDELMKDVARRLLLAVRTQTAILRRRGFRRSDPGVSDVVARIGGDEFVILLEGIVGIEDAMGVAERIQNALRPAFLSGEQHVFITASIGISANDADTNNTATILRGADAAMYKAKALGKGRYEVCDPIGNATAAHMLQLESDLRRAVENNEFELFYQPIVALKDFRIARFEALVRWNHPCLGVIPPASFIPLAEDTGLILPMGRWIMRDACRQMQQWNAGLAAQDPIGVCVNISPRQFDLQNLVGCVRGTLAETGLDARMLELEVTENLTMQDAERATEILRALTGLGVSISLDDFGTGYSSLSYLHRFPIRTLKIDRSFIARIGRCKESREIVQTIISLGHGLGMKVIAEGIENPAQVELLRIFRCDFGQGYLFSPPAPAWRVTEMLTARSRGEALQFEDGIRAEDRLAIPGESWQVLAQNLSDEFVNAGREDITLNI